MALVTLDDFKAYQGIALDDTSRDVTLQRIIDAVSDDVTRATGRQWEADPADDNDPDNDRTLTYQDGVPFIDLLPYEARSVSAVVIDPAGDTPLELTTDQLMLEPFDARDGVYDRITLADSVTYVRTGFPRVPVLVTGRWGWPAVPEFVKDWVLEMVEDRFREDVAVFADFDGNVGGGQETPGGPPITIPFRIAAQMKRLRRPYIGGA